MRYQITVPVLNEEERLKSGIDETIEFLRKKNLLDTWSIVIADNGSTDRTPGIGQELAKTHPHSVSYMRISAKGVGLAIRESWLQSDADIVGYMDVDLATELNHLIDVARCFESIGTHVVNGSRLLPDSEVIGRTLKREITSRGLNIIMRVALGVQFTDAMCGFKFFRHETAVQLLESIPVIPDWFVSAEMLVRAEWLGLTIEEIPVKWTDDPNSKAKVGKLAKQYLGHIHRLRQERRQKS